MKKVLMGWELGGGQGHNQRLLAIANGLIQVGFEPVFALGNLDTKAVAMPGSVYQAPRTGVEAQGLPDSYPDILVQTGYADREVLQRHLQAWVNVINSSGAQLVIADSAPGLVLAAKAVGIPVVVVGSGFTVVPASSVIIPPFRQGSTLEQMKTQDLLSEIIFNATRVDEPLHRLLSGDRSFVFTVPELDPYRNERVCNPNQMYVGAYDAPFPELYNPDGGGFAYLPAPYAFSDPVTEALALSTELGDLKTVLEGKSLALHSGGIGLTLACLLSGIPQLILPLQQEQYQTARAIQRLRVGFFLSLPIDDAVILQKAKEVVDLQLNLVEWSGRERWNHSYLPEVVAGCNSFV